MLKILHQGSTQSVLSQVQERFALMKGSGKIWFVAMQDIENYFNDPLSSEIMVYQEKAGRIFIEKYLETLPVPSDPKAIFREFMKSPSTKLFDGFCCRPHCNDPGKLNLWVDSPIVPKAGDWSAISEFLMSQLCDNSEEVYDYLLSYLAHMLQRPEEKPGVMIVMLGGEGTGKGTLFRIIEKIWPKTSYLVSSMGAVTGTYNAGLMTKYVVCLDEAIFAGDRAQLDKLKSLITEPRIGIEQKYQAS